MQESNQTSREAGITLLGMIIGLGMAGILLTMIAQTMGMFQDNYQSMAARTTAEEATLLVEKVVLKALRGKVHRQPFLLGDCVAVPGQTQLEACRTLTFPVPIGETAHQRVTVRTRCQTVPTKTMNRQLVTQELCDNPCSGGQRPLVEIQIDEGGSKRTLLNDQAFKSQRIDGQVICFMKNTRTTVIANSESVHFIVNTTYRSQRDTISNFATEKYFSAARY